MSTCLPIQRVLYVEDHPVNVLLMQALFDRRPRARLCVAATAADGLAQALEETPDLLLLDLRLPDCHGTELLQRMRGHASLAAVPAIAVTAEDTGDLSGRGLARARGPTGRPVRQSGRPRACVGHGARAAPHSLSHCRALTAPA